MINQISKTTEYAVRATVDGKDKFLIPGDFGKYGSHAEPLYTYDFDAAVAAVREVQAAFGCAVAGHWSHAIGRTTVRVVELRTLRTWHEVSPDDIPGMLSDALVKKYNISPDDLQDIMRAWPTQ